MSKKIITKKKTSAKDMKAWEKIFFMFYEEKKSYPSMKAVVEAVTEHYNLTKSMNPGTMCKAMKILSGTIEYRCQKYTIRKIRTKDANGNFMNNPEYVLVNESKRDIVWEDNRTALLEADLLENNSVCVVSEYMYIFKVKMPNRRKKKNETKEELEIRIRKERRENAKRVKNYFRQMINSDDLFDVLYCDGAIIVVLNSKERSKTRYADGLRKFFDLSYNKFGS